MRFYALALHELLEKEKAVVKYLTSARIREIASNGTLIIKTVNNKTYKSINSINSIIIKCTIQIDIWLKILLQQFSFKVSLVLQSNLMNSVILKEISLCSL